MKKLTLLLSSLIALLLLAALTLQSPWGKEKALALLADSLREAGLKVEIGAFHGSFPHHIELEEVKLESESWSVTCHHLEANLSLFRLLKKELYFSTFSADQIAWTTTEGAPVQRAKGLNYLVNVKHFSLTQVKM